MTDQELDALVAEKVMGFCIHIPGFTVNITNLQRICKRCDKMIDIKEFAAQHGRCNFSTDIAAAWEVVEKMQDRGIAIYFEDGVWEVDVDENFTVSARDDSAQKAICLAALKAVGVEVK